jgi:hypothetical protein
MLTQRQLKERLSYDPETGQFTWLIAPSNNVVAGSIAGSIMEDYRSIRVYGTPYKAHRLAWLYMTGEWPTCQIDHKDRNGLNNKWENLRLSTFGQNRANSKVRCDSQSGVKGVRWYASANKWSAQIRHKGKNVNLGYFETLDEAHLAYIRAAQQAFGEFARV